MPAGTSSSLCLRPHTLAALMPPATCHALALPFILHTCFFTVVFVHASVGTHACMRVQNKGAIQSVGTHPFCQHTASVGTHALALPFIFHTCFFTVVFIHASVGTHAYVDRTGQEYVVWGGVSQGGSFTYLLVTYWLWVLSRVWGADDASLNLCLTKPLLTKPLLT